LSELYRITVDPEQSGGRPSNFDKALTPFQGLGDPWKYRLEPKQKLSLSRVRQSDPDDRRSALAEKRSLSKIHIFRDDDSANAASILPNRLV
jgi:hypothetical protein